MKHGRRTALAAGSRKNGSPSNQVPPPAPATTPLRSLLHLCRPPGCVGSPDLDATAQHQALRCCHGTPELPWDACAPRQPPRRAAAGSGCDLERQPARSLLAFPAPRLPARLCLQPPLSPRKVGVPQSPVSPTYKPVPPLRLPPVRRCRRRLAACRGQPGGCLPPCPLACLAAALMLARRGLRRWPGPACPAVPSRSPGHALSLPLLPCPSRWPRRSPRSCSPSLSSTSPSWGRSPRRSGRWRGGWWGCCRRSRRGWPLTT